MAGSNLASDVAKASRLWGIVLIVLGILSIAAPHIAGASATMLIGICILIGGIGILIGAFQADSWGIGVFATLMGIITAIAGLYMLLNPVLGMMTITLFLAIYFIVDGVFQIIGAVQARPAGGWGWFLFGGILSVLLGYIIYSGWPVTGFWVVGTLIGIRLLFGGFAMMMVGSAASEVGKAIDAT